MTSYSPLAVERVAAARARLLAATDSPDDGAPSLSPSSGDTTTEGPGLTSVSQMSPENAG